MDLRKYFASTSSSTEDENTPSTSSACARGESTAINTDGGLNIPAEKESTATPSENEVKIFPSDSNESDIASKPNPKRKRPNTVRRYDEEYLKYGSVSIDLDGEPHPFCLLCKKSLANSSLFPKKLLLHLTSMHPKEQNKSIEYFKNLKAEYAKQRKTIDALAQHGLAAIESSFTVAYEIAKSKKAFSTAETLIQPCLLEVARIMFGENSVAKMKSISLSHQTIARGIEEMTIDVKQQLISRLRKSARFTLQFDESTDITNQAILTGFVRYVHEVEIVEDIFCFCSLPDRTTGEKIFEAINGKFQEYELDWKSVIGLCTDCAGAMLGIHVGLTTRMSEVANENFVSSHCILHREALASKKVAPTLNETLETSVKIINNIKANALHSRTVFQNE